MKFPYKVGDRFSDGNWTITIKVIGRDKLYYDVHWVTSPFGKFNVTIKSISFDKDMFVDSYSEDYIPDIPKILLPDDLFEI